MERVLLRDALLLDPEAPAPSPGALLLRDGRIEARLGPAERGPEDARAESLSGLLLAPAAAQDLNIINDPGAPQVQGATGRLRDDPAVQGGKALRIVVRSKGANPWDAAVQTAITQPVKAGDELLFAFWARLEKG